MNARRLDSEQVGQRQRVASLLERKDDLAGAVADDMGIQILDAVAVDRMFDRDRPVVQKPFSQADLKRTLIGAIRAARA